MQLAHRNRSSVAAACNHAKYLKQRTVIMQWWADYPDAQLAKGRRSINGIRANRFVVPTVLPHRKKSLNNIRQPIATPHPIPLVSSHEPESIVGCSDFLYSELFEQCDALTDSDIRKAQLRRRTLPCSRRGKPATADKPDLRATSFIAVAKTNRMRAIRCSEC